MNDTMSTEGLDGAKPKDLRMRQTLTLDAAVAILGMSVGVDAQKLLASGPGKMQEFGQSKLGGIQEKDRAMQRKVPALQEEGGCQPTETRCGARQATGQARYETGRSNTINTESRVGTQQIVNVPSTPGGFHAA